MQMNTYSKYMDRKRPVRTALTTYLCIAMISLAEFLVRFRARAGFFALMSLMLTIRRYLLRCIISLICKKACVKIKSDLGGNVRKFPKISKNFQIIKVVTVFKQLPLLTVPWICKYPDLCHHRRSPGILSGTPSFGAHRRPVLHQPTF